MNDTVFTDAVGLGSMLTQQLQVGRDDMRT